MKRTSIIAFLLILTLLVPMAASAATDESTLNGYPLQKGIYEGVTIKLVQPWWTATDDPKYEENTRVYREFEEHTGAKVEFITVAQDGDAFEGYKQAVINMVMANDAPDAVIGTTFPVPAWVSKNLIQPWNKYMDLSDLAAKNISPMAKGPFAIGEDVYGIQTPTTPIDNAMAIYYSKSAFENKGLDDPYELYTAGKWNWDAFIDASNALTYDGGSGAIDHFAIAGWYIIDSYQPFIAANGGDTVKIGEDGKPRFAMNDPETVFALNYAIEKMPLHADKLWPLIESYDWDIGALLFDGTVGMLHECYWWYDTALETMGEDLGIVPFPLGPDYKGEAVSRDYLEACYGWYLMAGAKNPQATADLYGYLWYANKEYDVPPPAVKGYPEIFGDRYDDIQLWTNNAALETARAYPGLEVVVANIYTAINANGVTPANATESAAQEAQAIIDAILAGN